MRKIDNLFGTTEKRSVMSSDKVGRNDPCPYGSGKKYKKCCGSVVQQKTHMAPRTFNAQLPVMGVPGEPQGLIACNHFRDEADLQYVEDACRVSSARSSF